MKKTKKLSFAIVQYCTDQLDQKILKNWSKSTYFYLKGIDVSCPVNFQHTKSNQYLLYKAILGPLKSCFDQLDQEFLKSWSYLSYPRMFISREMLFRVKSIFTMYFRYNPILSLLKSCFDKLDPEFSRCWSILAKNQIISLRKL